MLDRTTILYVDDEPMNITLFRANFRNFFNIVSANSGEQALEILESNNTIRIVISDMRMPNMSGVDFVKEAYKHHSDLKYYILSGFSITEEVKEILSKKIIRNYFNKPLNVAQILEELNCVRP